MGKKIIHFFIVLALILLGTFLYSRYVGITGLVVKERKIVNATLPSSFHGLKIIQISDLHYGNTVSQKEMKKLVKKINEIKPDIIVLTGDLLDKDIILKEKEQSILTNLLGKMGATIGKYAIKGENDVPHKEWESIMTESSFINLNDTFELIYQDEYTPILLAGMSTNLKVKKSPKEKIETTLQAIEEYKNKEGNALYSILLMHEPDYIDQFSYSSFHLILAGHSHGGQINLPLIKNALLPKGSKKYTKEHYKKGNTEFYISTGIGTNSLTYRLGNRPSIQFYRLVTK